MIHCYNLSSFHLLEFRHRLIRPSLDSPINPLLPSPSRCKCLLPKHQALAIAKLTASLKLLTVNTSLTCFGLVREDTVTTNPFKYLFTFGLFMLLPLSLSLMFIY